MSTPVLIDTDMGVDDAIAIGLALSCPELELVGLASVDGNVSLDQATINIPRVLAAFGAPARPSVARGLHQSEALMNAAHVHGEDGLGLIDLPAPRDFSPGELIPLYEQLIGKHGKGLTVTAIGPLTNLAHILSERPGLLQQVGRIVVMGGAIWCKGNINPHAEFNFYRDPAAAQAVLSSGLPVTVVSLDVTSQLAIDESHVARLSRSGNSIGESLARMLQHPISKTSVDEGAGRFLVHDAVTVGALLWPELFLQSRMALEVITSGPQAGQCKPKLAKDKARQISVVISVNADDFLENLMERLCQEKFVV